MTRVDDLIACCCCWRCTPSDDSMGEQVRSQPIVTNRSEISRGTSNCVKTLTLLFTKLHLEPYQSQTEVCLQRARLSGDYLSQKKKRGENKLYCSCQNFILSEFLLYKFLSICKHKHTHTKTHTPIHSHLKVHAYAHTCCNSSSQGCWKTCQTFTKRSKFIYLFEFRVITGITVVLGCDISL